jgi:hypothetical protein
VGSVGQKYNNFYGINLPMAKNQIENSTLKFLILMSIVSFYVMPANAAIGDVLISGESATISTGESWALREGYTLTPQQIDQDRSKVWIELSKNGNYVADKIITLSSPNWVYNQDVGGQNDIVTLRVTLSSIPSSTSATFVSIYQYSDGTTPTTGSISVSSNPSDANVYLDGAYKGTTPTTLYNVPIGSHAVKFTKLGYNDISSTVTVSLGQTASVSKTLTLEKGSISAEPAETSSRITIDYPENGDNLYWSSEGHLVKGSLSGIDDKFKPYVLVHPKTTTKWWVQLEPTISGSKWEAVVYPGTKDIGANEEYEIYAIVTDKSLNEGEELDALPDYSAMAYLTVFRPVQSTSPENSVVTTQNIKPEQNEFPIFTYAVIGLAILFIGVIAVKKKSSRKKSVATTKTAMDERGQSILKKGVDVKTAFGYKGATIQYKIKVENFTPEPIADIKVNLYVPDVFLVSESTKSIAMLKPDESKTVTFEIRPTGECGDCEVSGKVIYYDYSTKKTSEMDIPAKSLSIVCPMLKGKEISESEWQNIVSRFVETEESTREIDMPAETLFTMVSRIVKDMHMHPLNPEITDSPQLYNGVARFYGEGVKGLKYAAQIEVVGGEKKSKLILKTWAEKEEALTGFYHGLLDEIEKRVQIKGYINDSIVQNFYHYGDNVGTQMKDNFVYKSDVGSGETEMCPQCGKGRVEGEKFCSRCGAEFE